MDALDPRHGTSAGYYAHKRAGQTPCEPCKDGMNAYNRAYAAGHRASDHRTYDHLGLADDVELTDGHWAPSPTNRLVRVWVPNPVPPPPAEDPRRRYSKPWEAICGTDAGYYRHRRKYREPACEACKAAHRQAERDRDRTNRERVA